MVDYEAVFQRMAEKYRRTAVEAGKMKVIPYMSENGCWKEGPWDGNSWWTGGFWPALMWQFYAATKDAFFMTEARRAQELLVAEFRSFMKLHHDVGFMYLLSCGADHKLTGSEQARIDTLHAANLMMGRFNPAGFIRAWNGEDQTGYAIIDCMMNLSILFWASRQLKDPRFAHVACAHADTALKEFLRPDGSVSHIIEFDPATGDRVKEHPGQGYGLGSQWSRGQAWGLYGFALAHMNTGEKRYLHASCRIADNFIAHIRPDGLTDVDFCQPEGEERIDNLAAAIAGCGMLEIYSITGEEKYRAAAQRLVDGMLEHCADWGEGICGVLTHCTASYHDDGAGRNKNIIYGDYFLAEALAKLAGHDPMLWI